MNNYDYDQLHIEQYTWGIVNSNSYLITEVGEGLLIDAIDNVELFKTLERVNRLTIVLTHSHFDHIYGLNKIRSQLSETTVIATKQCSCNIGNKYKNMSAVANAFMSFYNNEHFQGFIESIICERADRVFENKLEFDWMGHRLNLVSMYGHSNDSLIAVLDSKYLFSGDSLLHTPTVTRFPGGSTKRFREEDLPILNTINAEMVFPGHGRPAPIADMLQANR